MHTHGDSMYLIKGISFSTVFDSSMSSILPLSNGFMRILSLGIIAYITDPDEGSRNFSKAWLSTIKSATSPMVKVKSARRLGS